VKRSTYVGSARHVWFIKITCKGCSLFQLRAYICSWSNLPYGVISNSGLCYKNSSNIYHIRQVIDHKRNCHVKTYLQKKLTGVMSRSCKNWKLCDDYIGLWRWWTVSNNSEHYPVVGYRTFLFHNLLTIWMTTGESRRNFHRGLNSRLLSEYIPVHCKLYVLQNLSWAHIHIGLVFCYYVMEICWPYKWDNILLFSYRYSLILRVVFTVSKY
jgi:hypothetical protein